MDPSPNMNQYVGLLELICSSSPIPTAEMLQDVSVLYARLGKDIHSASLLFLRVSHLFMSHLSAALCLYAQLLLILSLLIDISVPRC